MFRFYLSTECKARRNGVERETEIATHTERVKEGKGREVQDKQVERDREEGKNGTVREELHQLSK